MESEYFWRTTYRHGNIATSYETAYKDIDRANLSRFEIVRKSDGVAVISVPFEPADCLLWRRRVQMRSGNTQRALQVVCRERGIGRYQIHVLDEQAGEVRMHTRFNPNIAELTEPERLPFEI